MIVFLADSTHSGREDKQELGLNTEGDTCDNNATAALLRHGSVIAIRT